MKILCLCQKGNSRSVTLARLLKKKKHEAIATGMVVTSRKTREMLYNWADLIILVVPYYKHWIPESYYNKLRVWDVGRDRFDKGYSEELAEIYTNYFKNEGL